MFFLSINYASSHLICIQVLCYKSEALLKLHKPDEAEAVCAQAQKLETSLHKLGLIPADSFSHMLRAHIEMSLGRCAVLLQLKCVL